MIHAADSFGMLFKCNVDATRRYAIWVLDGVERVVKLQLDTFETLCAETGKAAQASLPKGALYAPLPRWDSTVQETTQHTVDLVRSYSDAAKHWLAEFNGILQEQEHAFNRHLVESVEEFVDFAGMREGRAAGERRREPAHVERKSSHKLAA